MPDKMQKKISVIIADDDFAIRNAFRECVKDSRYEIAAEAGDGIAAVELAREIKPDLAVLDIEMPAADGITACGILTEENLVRCAVMLTSFETGDYINAAIEKGAEGYVTKPFECGQLLSVLDMCYAQSKERYMLKKDCTNLKRKLDSKDITNKAKFIVMEKRGLDENDAYKYLREMSRRKGVSVETVAEMIIAEWENHKSE